jgi:hypothetical protein
MIDLSLSTLPGSELVREGMGDLRSGRETEAALLLAVAAPRLRALGLVYAEAAAGDPAHRLYELLSEHDPGGAHSRYNALMRRMVSFCRMAENASSG